MKREDRHITIWLDDVTTHQAGDLKTEILGLLATEGFGLKDQVRGGKVTATVWAGARKQLPRKPCNEANGWDREAGRHNAHVYRRALSSLGLTVEGTTCTVPVADGPHLPVDLDEDSKWASEHL